MSEGVSGNVTTPEIIVSPSVIDDIQSRLNALEKKEEKTDSARRFVTTLHGRFFFDGVFFADQDETARSVVDQENYLALREARLTLDGNGYKIYDYRVEFNFGARPRWENADLGTYRFDLRDLYFGVRKVPVLDYVKFGHYRVENGMAFLRSGNFSTGMGSNPLGSFFSLGRRFGVSSTQFRNHDRLRWFNGVFADQENNFASSKAYVSNNQGIILNTRLSMLPFESEDGKQYLHLGGSYSYDSFVRDNNPVDVAIRPRGGAYTNTAPQITIPTFTADHLNIASAEFVYTHNRFGAETEFHTLSYGNGRDVYGGYAEIRYFLTDAYRSYDKNRGTTGAPITNNDLEFVGTNGHYTTKALGDWETFAQWGFTDLSNLQANTTQQDFILGLNWHWNPNTRMIFEYTHSMPKINSEIAHVDIVGISLRYFF